MSKTQKLTTTLVQVHLTDANHDDEDEVEILYEELPTHDEVEILNVILPESLRDHPIINCQILMMMNLH